MFVEFPFVALGIIDQISSSEVGEVAADPNHIAAKHAIHVAGKAFCFPARVQRRFVSNYEAPPGKDRSEGLAVMASDQKTSGLHIITIAEEHLF